MCLCVCNKMGKLEKVFILIKLQGSTARNSVELVVLLLVLFLLSVFNFWGML